MSRLFDRAKELLDYVAAEFPSDPKEGGFDRVYVSDGSVAFDLGETLAVEWEGRLPGQAGAPADVMPAPGAFRAVFSVHAARESWLPDEGGTPPLPERLTEMAELVHEDADTILSTIQRGLRENTLFGQCAGALVLSQDAMGPDGGVCGSVTRVEVTI